MSTVPLRVLNNNRAPEIETIANQSLSREDILELTINAVDADGDAIILSASGLTGFDIPEFASFADNGDGTASIQLTPAEADRGDYTIVVTATDGTNSSETSFVVSVEGVNDPPRWQYLGDVVAVLGETNPLELLATDSDQDGLSFSAEGLPPGVTLTPSDTYGRATLTVTPDTAGVYPLTLIVTDSGNGEPSAIEKDSISFNLIVREDNLAPVLAPIGTIEVREGETLTLPLLGTDEDGDTLTYSATNLPPGAYLERETGIITWTPTYLENGIYSNIEVEVSDGHSSSNETITIEVENVNQAPVLIPLPPQSGREGTGLQFTLAAGDVDGDALAFQALTPLPQGVEFNDSTGGFGWTPGYDQAGVYSFTFAVIDSSGLSHSQDVAVTIANVNRAPSLEVASRSVVIGEELNFTLEGTDPDGDVLSYTALGLPEGAILNSQTGEVTWTPNPGQIGEYTVTFQVDDGETTAIETTVLTAGLTPLVPDLKLVLTPSFPVQPGQSTSIRAIGDGSITINIDGEVIEVESGEQVLYIPDEPGQTVIEATLTNLTGQSTTTTEILKTRRPDDQTPPDLNLNVSGTLGEITARVEDLNLDQWTLELRELGEQSYEVIAQGNSPLERDFQLDSLGNGFYEVRLSARDIGGRSNTITETVEINSLQQGIQKETDLSFGSIELSRVYENGNGWSFEKLDGDIATKIQNPYEPLQFESRLYLTLPTGKG